MTEPAAAAAAETRVDDLVLLEQVQHLYGQLKRSTLGMVVGGAVVAFALWERVAIELLVAWLGAIAVNQTWRLWWYLKFLRQPPLPEHAREWARHWAFGAGISGTIWGSTALFMFVPDSAGHQAFLAAALIGVTAGALALITIHRPSFYAFVFPTLVPITLRLFYEGDRLHVGLALACLIVFVSALKFGRELNRKLTESIHLRLDLEVARASAEAATRAKSDFLSATAHDIGHQTVLLLGHAKQIAGIARTPDEARLVQRLDSTVSTLAEMVGQLRQFSEIESGRLQPELTTIHLQDLFEQALKEFKPMADAKALKLKVLDTGATVRTDPVLLRRMVWNLISNAMHYTSRGGVLVCARKRGQLVRIEIYDTGLGIAERDRERIFLEFQRVHDPADADHHGMGLGLAIVRGFAALLDHPIDLTSVFGRGSRFAISLPLAPHAPDAAPAAGPEPDVFAGRCVVLVDDDDDTLEQIAATLRRWGCEVVAVSTVEDALEALKSRTPELIIADFALADDATGFEAIDRIRGQAGRRVPAFLITGSARTDVEDLAAARQLAVIRKPVRPEHLGALVGGMLAARPAAS